MYLKFFFAACVLAAMSVACTDTTPPAATASKLGPAFQKFGTKTGALTVDPATGKTMACKLTDAPMLGPQGQGKVCDRAAMMWAVVIPDDACTYPDNAFAQLSCNYVPCQDAAECDDNLSGTVDACEWTESSVAKGTGICLHYWDACSVGDKGTLCHVEGFVVCDSKGKCACDAVMPAKGSTETCNNLDDDCNGKTDDGKNADGSDFNLGKACDGDDTDKCTNGTWTCASNGMGAECVNEFVKNIGESCDGVDNDCNGVTDDKWPTLGQACDGDDSDKCANGVVTCADKNSVSCLEIGKNVTEWCDGKDNTCEGNTDEGCDDDGDLYCDMSMKVSKDAKCSKSKLPLDASQIAGDDCNDSAMAINLGATEMCDTVDNNCDGKTDDGFFLGDACVSGNNDGVCMTTGKFASCAADGKTAVCDAKKDQTKVSAEVCDNLDNNCDGKTDEGCDDDNDGYCDASMKVSKDAKCSKSKLPADASQIAGDDCNDSSKNISPAATESCNGLDDQCDGKTDEGCDDDADGFCDSAMVFASGASCKQSVGGVGDCNDNDKSVNPDAVEVCDTVDNNCDGKTDKSAAGVSVCATACANAVLVNCGDAVSLSMKTNPFKGMFTPASSYTCPVAGKSTLYNTNVGATELYVVVQGAVGKIATMTLAGPKGTSGRAFLLNSCSPANPGAYSDQQCLAPAGNFGTLSTGVVKAAVVGNVKVGSQVIAIDSDGEIDGLTAVVTCN
jgi:hypothetical protein